MRYTIELDNAEGRGEIKLIDGIIYVINSQGVIQSTDVESTANTLDKDISYLYSSSVWDLRIEED